jgi:hypothetical protein
LFPDPTRRVHSGGSDLTPWRQRRAWLRRNDVADVIEEVATATLSGV